MLQLRTLATLAAGLSLALASLAAAQAVNTTPPAQPVCPPGNQDPACLTLPAPTPPPAPRPAPKAEPRGGGLMTGFATGSTAGLRKVISHFQRGVQRIDATKAFGFVVIPRAALNEQDLNVQRQFCQIMLASLDYETPDGATSSKLLTTYWPISTVVERWQIEAAFRGKRCDDLIAWYDHSLARSIANKAEIAHLSGPLLITWPSENTEAIEDRDPLIVDFAMADEAHATKALQYWFRQLNSDPELWTNRIREGTIRAELADAINDTAGVMMAVLYGKWESAAAVNETP
jgi:hypothetical protein